MAAETYTLLGRSNAAFRSRAETHTIDGGSVKVIERFFELPLDYANPDGPKLRIFARNLVPTKKSQNDEQTQLPFILYLQGGPGFECDLETSVQMGGPTLWLDSRGTGLSTPFSAELVEGKTDTQLFDYLKHFRADNIGRWFSNRGRAFIYDVVRDCEAIRTQLLGHKEDPEDRKWTILGQSFGGFVALTYLSFYPEGLKEVFLTAGLTPLVDAPASVFATLMERVIERNKIYYEKYPRDVHRILNYLDSHDVRLPNGGRLSTGRWLQLGIDFGMHGGIDRVHQLVLRAANDLELFSKLSYRLLHKIETKQECDSNPFYAILHEVIYCQGRAANWACGQVLSQYPQFLWDKAKAQPDVPVYFTGEMVFPEMLEEYANLRSLKTVANMLAEYSEWPALYDKTQLAKNTVKVTSATYFDDMYVDFNRAQETARAIGNLEQYISNQHMHSAIRKDPATVIGALFKIARRERD
ncbi:Proline iminopeptidase [Mycena indigotica]|uniref:Proline iminopeptidase n=1 Tax=Mycena indigotica TaxID=2126181 RepID=A0A8H6WER5_9AGAR|nr:Proline iminopeptidase [Mycena indigotica]KAF7315974.1 Proline iminopeptidase [Mycena indigotica]